MDLTPLINLARHQGGVCSVRQARALGHTASSVHELLRRGIVTRPRRAALLLPGADPTAEHTAAWLGLCSIGAPAWVGGPTTLSLLGAAPRPSTLHVVVPRDRRPRPQPGLLVHRVDDGVDVSPRRIRGVPSTDLETALLLTARHDTPRAVLAATASCVQLGLTTLDELAGAVPPRRRGAPVLRDCLVRLGATGAHSVLAHDVTTALRQAGIPVDAEVSVCALAGARRVTDLRVRRTPVLIEVDGHAVHHTRAQLAADRRRSNQLVAAGFTVLRVDWVRFTTDLGGFLTEVRAAVRRTTSP